jgi:hypothetical protein
MLTVHFVRLIELINGQTWIASLAGETVTERTLRNWRSGKTTPSEAQISRLQKASKNCLHSNQVRNGVPDENIRSHADEITGEPGLMSALVRNITVDADIYSRTLNLARKVDHLSNELLRMRQAEQLAELRHELLECSWLTTDHWHMPLSGAECPDKMRRLTEQARNWEELDIPLNVLMINVLLQFLATLDLEFCASYAPSFEATPLFTRLHPAFPINAVDEFGEYIARKRDPVRQPIRRLIDLMACMRQRKLEGRWPDKIPKVNEMADWMAVDESKLRKWRLGQRFTGSHFCQTWDAMFSRFDCDRRPSTPWPLLIAAYLLTILYMKGNRVRKETQTVIIAGPSNYLKWWNTQKHLLSNDEKGLRFGTAPWPDLLN